MSELSVIEKEQYARHIQLTGFGSLGQLRLKAAKVLLVGAGGLGCPIGLYLAAAGVGLIGVVDFDNIERSNLQRQIAHSVEHLGESKTNSLIAAMRALNPLIQYQDHPYRLEAHNALATIQDYDLIIDGSDNFNTRFMLADACYQVKKPILQGSVHEYEAQIVLIRPNGPCYRCLFPTPPQRNLLAPCATSGILGVVPGTAGLLMATEAIQFLTEMPTVLHNGLLCYHALHKTLRTLEFNPDPDCPLCGQQAGTEGLSGLITESLSSLKKDANIMNNPTPDMCITQEEAKRLLDQGAVLVDVREDFEYQAGHLPNALQLPMSQLDENKVKALLEEHLEQKDSPFVVYCEHGKRSLYAVEWFRQLGFKHAFSMNDGYSVWDGPTCL